MNHKATLKVWIFAGVIFATAAAFPELLRAQAVSGDLVGIVTDATGAAVPNATVTAANDATGVKTVATTDSSGAYRLANLPVSFYTLTAAVSGFRTATVKSVQVQLNNTVTQNVTVSVGSTSTVVEVSAAAAPLDTTTSQVQTIFASREAEDLPVF